MDALSAAPGSAVQQHRVERLETEPAAGSDDHRHVVALETVDAAGRTFRWTLVQVIAAMRDGERFVLGGSTAGQAAALEPTVCPHCSRATLTPLG